jgi:hypothetical protein
MQIKAWWLRLSDRWSPHSRIQRKYKILFVRISGAFIHKNQVQRFNNYLKIGLHKPLNLVFPLQTWFFLSQTGFSNHYTPPLQQLKNNRPKNREKNDNFSINIKLWFVFLLKNRSWWRGGLYNLFEIEFVKRKICQRRWKDHVIFRCLNGFKENQKSYKNEGEEERRRRLIFLEDKKIDSIKVDASVAGSSNTKRMHISNERWYWQCENTKKW